MSELLMSAQCHETMFVHGDLLHAECLKSLIAKVLGYGILFGAVGVKLPQILNIISASSVEGLSALSFYIEVPLTITHCTYNFLQNNPFSSYGDAVMVLAQNLILVSLFWKYERPRTPFSTIFTVLLMFAAVTAISLSLPSYLQFILPLCNLPLMLSSRIPQIIKNIQQRSTGSLSSITNFLIFIGSFARIFTTLQEVGMDIPQLINYSLGSLTAGILFFQVLWYAKRPKTERERKKE